MKRTIFAIILLFTLIHVGDAVDNLSSQRLFDVIKSEKTTLALAIPDLKKRRIILIGVHHNQKSHHIAHLLITRALNGSQALKNLCCVLLKETPRAYFRMLNC